MSSVEARFAANLRRERMAAALSQEELALRADLHRTEVDRLEQGLRQPTMGAILRLAGALEISPDALLDGISWHAAEDGRRGRFESEPGDDPGP